MVKKNHFPVNLVRYTSNTVVFAMFLVIAHYLDKYTKKINCHLNITNQIALTFDTNWVYFVVIR